MRALLCSLLWVPCLAFAGPYKCVVNGQTIYSQERCGADAQQVGDKLSGIQDPASVEHALGLIASAPSSAQSAASAPASSVAPSLPLGVMERKDDCHTRYRQYQDSLACFAPYWHGTHLDAEAYDHCTVVKQPTDCAIDEMK